MSEQVNMVKGHPDPRRRKITKDGMVPLTRIEGRNTNKPKYGKDKEEIDQLIAYEWPGE